MNFHKNSVLYGAYYYFSFEANLKRFNAVPITLLHNAGMQAGKIYKRNRTSFGFSAGIGLSWGIYRGKYLGSDLIFDHYQDKYYLTCGLKFEGDWIIRLSKGSGIGMKVYTNINPVSPNIGYIVFFRFGKL